MQVRHAVPQPGIDVQVQRRAPQRPQSAYIERDLVRTASVDSQVRTSLGAVPNGYPIASPPGSPSGASDGRLILHPFIGKKTSLMKDVQHGETRHNDHRRQPNHHQHSC
jgi:hypothetical protein